MKLAWVTAQIHCQCSVSENRLVLPVDVTRKSANELRAVNSETSFVPFKGMAFCCSDTASYGSLYSVQHFGYHSKL